MVIAALLAFAALLAAWLAAPARPRAMRRAVTLPLQDPPITELPEAA